MDIKRIDHYSIRTLDVEASRKFYTEIIGLNVGPRPAFKFPGLWLYNGKPPADLENALGNYGIVHVMGIDPARLEYLATSNGLGNFYEADIQQRGEAIASVRTNFKLIDKFAEIRLT